MNITEINECLSELPEISILEFYRPRSPIAGVFNWAVWENTNDSVVSAPDRPKHRVA